jgi:hypothetical protein
MIPIGKLGRIRRGEYAGWFVRVDDDSESTGGFLALISPDQEFAGPLGYDNWAEDEAALERYFRKLDGDVEWETG